MHFTAAGFNRSDSEKAQRALEGSTRCESTPEACDGNVNLWRPGGFLGSERRK